MSTVTYCQACGSRLPDLADLNLPEVPGDVPTLTITRDDAVRFRTAYLSFFTFWLAHQSEGNLINLKDLDGMLKGAN